jgi:hypothetical protein
MPKGELLHWPSLPYLLDFRKDLFGFASGATLPHDMAEAVERKIQS